MKVAAGCLHFDVGSTDTPPPYHPIDRHMPRPPAAFALSLSAWLVLAGASAAAEPAPAKALAGVERDVRVQQYVESAQRKREAGDFEQALADLRAANALVKKSRGDGHPDQLPLLDLAAEILVENDKMQEAEGPLQKAVAIREALAREGQSSQEVPLAASLLLLGKVHASLGKYESVVDMLKKAVRVLDTSLGPEHEKTFQARRELARSVEIFEETLGPEHPATLKALEELDEVQAALGDWTAAAANARKIIEVKREKFGAAGPEALEAVMTLTDLIALGGAAAEAITIQADAIAAAEAADAAPAVLVPSLRHLGALHLANEDYSPAIDAFMRSRDLATAHLGADGAEPLIDRLHLVDVAQKRGDDDPWDAGFEQIVARLQELAGQGDPRAAEGLRLAAGVLLAADSFDRASELYREALTLDQRLLGPAHVDVAEDQLGLGRCLVGNGDTAAAESLLRTALQTMQREHGPAHAATLAAVTRLAECAVRAGDAKAAEKYVAQILERRVPRQGAHAEEEFCRLVDAAAALCKKSRDVARGEALRDQLVAIRRAQFGESHEHVADVLVAMANARQAARDYAAATTMYETGIAIYAASLGGEHPDIAAALLPLARAYRAAGNNELAEKTLRRALGIWEATVGPDHEVTLATVKPLALVLLALDREGEAIPLMERLLAGLDADPEGDDAEKMKLLTKLAELRESVGEADAARRDLRRAIEIEMRLADGDAGDSATDLADIARLQQLLGDDEAAAVNLARARAMAEKLPDAKDQIAKIEATAKAVRAATAAAPTADKPAPPPTTSAAAVIAAARSDYRLGKRNEARRRLENALGEARSEDPAQSLDRANLLVALADMRRRTTDYDTAAVLYEEARKIAVERGGSSSPRALVIALRLLGIRQAQGQEKAATALVDGIEKNAEKIFTGGPSAEAMDELREEVRRAEAVSLAAGDRKSARRLLEIGIALAGRPDRRATLAALDTLAVLLASGRSSSAAALRSRLLDAAMLNSRRDDPLSARFLFHRGVAAEQEGDLGAADRDLRRALELDEATQGREHPLVAVDLLRLAKVRELSGDRAGATEARSRAVAIAEQTARAPANTGLADLRALAVALGAVGETNAATKLVKAAVDARLKSDGTKSVEVARLLADSAEIFKRRGNVGRAAELLAEAMEIADTAVGAGHFETLALAAKLQQLQRFGATDQFATRTSVPLAAASARQDSAAASEPLAGNLAMAPAPAATGRDVPVEAAPAQPVAPDAADQVASSQPSSAKADQARRAFDAALHLYGGDPKKKGRRGMAKQGLENMLAYSSMVEGMSGGPDAGSSPATADRPAPESGAGESVEEARPQKTPERPRAQAKTAPTRPQETPRTPFVAASQSGLRYRTALAKQRAQGVDTKAQKLSLDALLRAAWSAHRAGAGEDAARACDQAVEVAVKESGEAASPLAETLEQVAAIAIARADYARARTWLERLGKVRWRAHGGSDARTVDVAAQLAAVLAECGEYARARKLGDRVLEQREPRAQENPAALARALVVRGQADLGLGDPAAAVGRARAAAALLENAWDDKGPRLAADESLVRLQLAITALLLDTGDVEPAHDRAERLWAGLLQGQNPRPETLVSAAAVLARARRLAGD